MRSESWLYQPLAALTWFLNGPTLFVDFNAGCAFLALNVGLTSKVWQAMQQRRFFTEDSPSGFAMKLFRQAERREAVTQTFRPVGPD